MKYFTIMELVSKDIFTQYGSDAIYKLDKNMLLTIDSIRAYFGKVIINTWCWGGSNQYRGYRADNEQIGADKSMHHFGRAFDITIDKMKADIILDELQNKSSLFPFITRMYKVTENTVHIDNKGIRENGKISIINI